MSSLPAFTPIGATATLAASGVSSNVALNRAGANQVLVLNLGDAEAFIDFGDSAQVATTTDTPLPAGGWIMLSVPPAATHAAAITATGTATLRFTPGDGEFQGSVGGAGSGTSGNPAEVNLIQVGSTAVVTGGVSGLLGVGGNAASGATDSGNPVKVGGIFQTTLPVLTNGQRGDIQLTTNGQLLAAVSGVAGAGVDGVANVQIFPIGSTNHTQRSGLSVAPLLFNPTTTLWDRPRNTGVVGGAAVAELGPYLLGRVTADGQIKGSAGFIHTISIAPLTATPTAGLLTVYNSLTETGAVVYSEWIFATTPGHTVTLDIPCSTGIFVGFDGALANVQVTVAYR